jgi:hypothetical protein
MSRLITVAIRLNLNAEAVTFMCYQSGLRRNVRNMLMKLQISTGDFLYQLTNYQLITKDPAPRC